MSFCKVTHVVWMSLNIVGIAISIEIRVVTPSNNQLLESPQWSTQENVLYYVDFFTQNIFRYDPINNQMTNRSVDYGITTLVLPIKGCPKILLVGVRNELFILNWDSPPGDSSLRQFSVLDIGKPDNNINDGKVDALGNLWVGTFGKLYQIYPEPKGEHDQASLYMVNRYNYVNPQVKIRPVSISNGIAWSSDNKKMYYVDSLTRKIAAYDFILKRSDIQNRTILFNFDDYNIPGAPDGMTIDIDDNLWVATVQGGEVLKIDSKKGKLLQRIKIPADIVSSVMWGDEDLSTLYVTTGQVSVESPQPLSGCLFALRGLGTKGRPENLFIMPRANKY